MGNRLNLYRLHKNPEELDHYDQRYKMPSWAWKRATALLAQPGSSRSDIIPLEQYIAKGDYESYSYATDIIR